MTLMYGKNLHDLSVARALGVSVAAHDQASIARYAGRFGPFALTGLASPA